MTQLLGCLQCLVTFLASSDESVVRIASVGVVAVDSVVVETAINVARRVLTGRTIVPGDYCYVGVLVSGLEGK